MWNSQRDYLLLFAATYFCIQLFHTTFLKRTRLGHREVRKECLLETELKTWTINSVLRALDNSWYCSISLWKSAGLFQSDNWPKCICGYSGRLGFVVRRFHCSATTNEVKFDKIKNMFCAVAGDPLQSSDSVKTFSRSPSHHSSWKAVRCRLTRVQLSMSTFRAHSMS